MSKMTVEQAVRALQTTRDEDTILLALKDCTKSQLHEIFLAVTGRNEAQSKKSMKKLDLLRNYLYGIMSHKARERFASAALTEKVEYLSRFGYEQDHASVFELLDVCSLFEVVSICTKLNVSFTSIIEHLKMYNWVKLEVILPTLIERRLYAMKKELAQQAIETPTSNSAFMTAYDALKKVQTCQELDAVLDTLSMNELHELRTKERLQVSQARLEDEADYREAIKHSLGRLLFKVNAYKEGDWQTTHSELVIAWLSARDDYDYAEYDSKENELNAKFRKAMTDAERDEIYDRLYLLKADKNAHRNRKQAEYVAEYLKQSDVASAHEVSNQATSETSEVTEETSRRVTKAVNILKQVGIEKNLLVLSMLTEAELDEFVKREHLQIQEASTKRFIAYVNAIEEALILRHSLVSSYQDDADLRSISELVRAWAANRDDANNEETYYSPDYQENVAVLQDIPADHEPDVEPVMHEDAVGSYASVKEAYERYATAQCRYEDSHHEDKSSEKQAQEEYRHYISELIKYRKSGMPEREEVLNWIRLICVDATSPFNSLLSRCNPEMLIELSHRCGIHAAWLVTSSYDVALRLLRESGIDTWHKTTFEGTEKDRSGLQESLHKYWSKRHEIRKAQRVMPEGSYEAYEELGHLWELYEQEAEKLLESYREVSVKRAELRQYEREAEMIYTASYQPGNRRAA